MNNREKFLAAYTKHLLEQVRKHPRNVPDIASKMVEALGKGAANKDTDAIRATLKELGIKNTYIAIKEYLCANKVFANVCERN